MAAGTRRDGYQAVRAFFNGFVGKHIVDHIVQHHAAPGLHRAVDVLTRAQTGNHDRHFVFFADLHVVIESVITFVHDLVDGIGRGGRLRVGFVVGGQRLGDFGQPFVQLGGGAGIKGWHRPHHPGFALGDNQFGVADDEQRGSNDGKAQGFEYGREVAGGSSHRVGGIVSWGMWQSPQ